MVWFPCQECLICKSCKCNKTRHPCIRRLSVSVRFKRSRMKTLLSGSNKLPGLSLDNYVYPVVFKRLPLLIFIAAVQNKIIDIKIHSPVGIVRRYRRSTSSGNQSMFFLFKNILNFQAINHFVGVLVVSFVYFIFIRN